MRLMAIDRPLFRALRTRDVDGVRRALDAGADPNARGQAGVTPLMFAVQIEENHNVVDLLLERGADLRATDARGRTAVDHVYDPPEPPEDWENGHEAWIHHPDHYLETQLYHLLQELKGSA